MELTSTAILISLLIYGFYYIIIKRRSSTKYPPGPYPLPILGNIHLLGSKPHRSLARLSKTYGPLMHLKLGTMDAIIVSNSQVCKELLHKNDHLSSCRPQIIVTQTFDHARLSIAWLPPNEKWRKLRRICKEHLFAASKLDATEGLRKEKLRKLRAYLEECSVRGLVVDISEALFLTTLNLVWDTLFSLDFADYGTDSSQEIFTVVTDLLHAWGSPNAADFFPILKRFDPQGINRAAETHTRRLFEILDGIIHRRLQSRESSNDDEIKSGDMLESLLDIHRKNPSEFSLNDIKHLLLDLTVGGSETSASVVTWAMTELLRNPEKLTKVKKELNAVISEGRSIEESDISNLPYLQAVVKESLRLYPPAPLLPRSNDQNDLKINGHDIPKNARILINIWAMGQDSSVWSDPDSFSPERFVEQEIDVKGNDFRFIPFGTGRRMCPGMPLGSRMSHLILASFVRDFDWKLEYGLKPEDIDMSERFGLVLEKAAHLKAIPVKTG